MAAGPLFTKKMPSLTGIGIPILNQRRSGDRLGFLWESLYQYGRETINKYDTNRPTDKQLKNRSQISLYWGHGELQDLHIIEHDEDNNS